MGKMTNFFPGVSTADPSSSLAEYGLPDPTNYHTYFNDFDTYVAGDWTITNASSGTIALTDADGGVLLVTNNTSDDNAVFLDKKGESFLLESGKPAWFKCRVKVSDATQSDMVIGLQITDTTPLDVTDGIYFLKSDGSASVSAICRKNASTGSTSATVATMADDTYIVLGWYYDGNSSVAVFVNGAQVTTLDGSSSYLPDTELTVSFGIQNGEAAAKTMSVDYILAAKAR